MDASQYSTKKLDHLGIVAGICNEIGLVRRIDELMRADKRRVTVGQAVQAMVLNGLGFVSRPLYLSPEFFENKAVDVLVGEGIEAEDLNSYSLGRALDRLYEVGVTEVFAHVAASAVRKMGIATDFAHLDSTSFALHGEYESATSDENAIEVTYGYSRDHRPDLKQVVLSLICTHQAGIPTWLTALGGNQADSASFPQTVRAYVQQLKANEEPPYFVADTALYSAGTLHELGDDVQWVTRVPASIAAVKALYQTVSPDDMLPDSDGTYRTLALCSTYGGVRQRWLLVYSEATYQREAGHFNRRKAKERTAAEKAMRRLGRREYPTSEAAQAAVETLSDTWKFHTAQVEVVSQPRYHKRGRPSAAQPPDYLIWKPIGQVLEDDQAVMAELAKKGKFVLATNELDTDRLPDEALIPLYKGQIATVERGFRFLKDPLFFAHSLFLKKPARIMALLMVMGLCLLVYALAEHRLRSELVRQHETVPDQKGKPTQRITMRRVFQVFEGIDVLTFNHPGQPQRFIINLTDLHRQIIRLLGPPVEKCYSLSP